MTALGANFSCKQENPKGYTCSIVVDGRIGHTKGLKTNPKGLLSNPLLIQHLAQKKRTLKVALIQLLPMGESGIPKALKPTLKVPSYDDVAFVPSRVSY